MKGQETNFLARLPEAVVIAALASLVGLLWSESASLTELQARVSILESSVQSLREEVGSK